MDIKEYILLVGNNVFRIYAHIENTDFIGIRKII